MTEKLDAIMHKHLATLSQRQVISDLVEDFHIVIKKNPIDFLDFYNKMFQRVEALLKRFENNQQKLLQLPVIRKHELLQSVINEYYSLPKVYRSVKEKKDKKSKYIVMDDFIIDIFNEKDELGLKNFSNWNQSYQLKYGTQLSKRDIKQKLRDLKQLMKPKHSYTDQKVQTKQNIFDQLKRVKSRLVQYVQLYFKEALNRIFPKFIRSYMSTSTVKQIKSKPDFIVIDDSGEESEKMDEKQHSYIDNFSIDIFNSNDFQQ